MLENGNKNIIENDLIADKFKKSSEPYKEIPINTINSKLNEDTLEIKDILQNQDCIYDLINNRNCKYKKIITLTNIKILIKYCLDLNFALNNNSEIDLRFPYYSSEILCSQCVLLFNKSISYIRKFSLNEENNQNNQDSNEINGFYMEERKLINDDNNNLMYNNNEDDIIRTNNFENYNQEIDNYFNNDHYNEKYLDLIDVHKVETELKIESIKNRADNIYDDKDMIIINEILNDIFNCLSNFNYDKYQDNQTYFGYFQKIVKYLLLHEPDITINYLFETNKSIFFHFYKYLNEFSIQNILQNILNILYDNEEKYDKKNSRYLKIIKDLFQELSDFNDTNKSLFICELIINTIIENSEKQLINFFFIDENNMSIIIKLIERIIKDNKDKNDKILIGILKILCKLNSTIISSFSESDYFAYYKDELDIEKTEKKRDDALDYQYITKKKINYKNIFKAYDDKIVFFYKVTNEIFNLIKDNIKERWKSLNQTNIKAIDINNYYNKNINNNFLRNKQIDSTKESNDNCENNKNMKLGLKYLYEWKYIHSSLEIYVYSFYVIKDDIMKSFFVEKVAKYFLDVEFFHILVWFYFNYRQNNIFQNSFISIIDLICKKKCPEYLTKQFLTSNQIMKIINNTNQEENIITLIIKNLEKENNNKKTNQLIGLDITILQKFFNSFNPAVIEFFQKNEKERYYKTLFMDTINDKFDRKLDEDYSFAESEIFNEELDKNDTFDGNDSFIEKKYRSIYDMVEKFLKKCKLISLKFQKNNNNNNTRLSMQSTNYDDVVIDERTIYEWKNEFDVNMITKNEIEIEEVEFIPKIQEKKLLKPEELPELETNNECCENCDGNEKDNKFGEEYCHNEQFFLEMKVELKPNIKEKKEEKKENKDKNFENQDKYTLDTPEEKNSKEENEKNNNNFNKEIKKV